MIPRKRNRDYLEKSRGGIWRGRLNRMREDAIALRERAKAVIASQNYLPGQDASLLQSSRQNEATLKAIDAYLKVLDSHEAVIDEKLATARKVREVIAISYETLNLADDFIQFAKSSQDLFNSLQQQGPAPVRQRQVVLNSCFQSSEGSAVNYALERVFQISAIVYG